MLTQELHTRGKSMSFDSRSGKASTDAAEVSHEEYLSVPGANPSEYLPVEISAVEPASSAEADLAIDKHPIITAEIPVVDKVVVDEVFKNTEAVAVPTSNANQTEGSDREVAVELSKDIKSPAPSASRTIDQKDEDDVDDWLKEDSTEGGSFKGTSYHIGQDDDVSFSDLEEEDDVPTSYKKDENPSSSGKESSDWIQLSADSSRIVNRKSMDSSRSNKVSAHKNKKSSDWLDVEDIDDA